jgi:hypothetical protein
VPGDLIPPARRRDASTLFFYVVTPQIFHVVSPQMCPGPQK